MYFVGGGLIGILLFGQTYPLWEKLYTSQYLGTPKLSDSLGMKDGVFGLIVIAAAILMFWIGEMAEKRFKREDISNEL